jgi:hypothetical protein
MKMIVPCAGKSAKFPNMRPNYMLTHPDGNLMVKKAIEGIKGIEKKDIIITLLKEHEEKYNIVKGLKENIGQEIQIILLDEPTKSQSEAVYKTIKKANINEEFFVKDSDNTFFIEISGEYSFVCYSDLVEYSEINPADKSYILMNNQGFILQMIEKKIISQTFNVGGYFFKDPKKFIKTYEKLSKKVDEKDLYISYIIEDMIINENEIFMGKKVSDYHDWGTAEDWFKYRKKFKTYFFDIDGIFFKNAAQFHNPLWINTTINIKNVNKLIELSTSPYNQIFFITSRPESYRKLLEKEFKKLGIKYSELIMGCLHAKRIIVNDFSNTTGFPTCEAINIPRDSEDLDKYLNS